MDLNEYSLEWHARLLLTEARAASARAALVSHRASRLRPTLTAAVTAARALYARATTVGGGRKAPSERAYRDLTRKCARRFLAQHSSMCCEQAGRSSP